MKRMLLGALALLATWTSAPLASADVWTNASGSTCKALSPTDAPFIYALMNGTYTVKTTPTTVMCPLTRSTINTKGAYIYVDVYHKDTAFTTTCTAYSTAPSGDPFGDRFPTNILAYASGSYRGLGTGSIFLNLAGLGRSGFTSDYVVMCTLSSGVTLTGVHIDEL